MAAAGDWELEAVNVESLLIGVGKQPHKVVLLQTLGGQLSVVNVRAGGTRVPAIDKISFR